MFNTFLGVIATLVMVGSASLSVLFENIRDEVIWQHSKFSKKVEKLCKIGIVISIIMMFSSAILLFQFLSITLFTTMIS